MRSRSAKHITAGAIGLGLLFIVVANSQAQSTNYWWTGADNNGIWEDANNWVLTNGVAATTYPANPVTQPPGSETDVAIFTNSGTYAVTVTTVGNLNIQSNFFNNASNSTATVTLTVNNSGTFYLQGGGTDFEIADGVDSTSIVYLASSPSPNNGLIVKGTGFIVGHDGVGTLIFTNGFINTSASVVVDVGSGGGNGTVIISGPNTYWEAYQFAIGDTNASYGNSVIISNSASLTAASTFRIGSSSTTGSSNCLFVVTDGGYFAVNGGSPLTVGNRGGTLSAASASYNNTVIVGNGGVINIPDHSIVVGNSATMESGISCSSCAAGGTTATGNFFIVEAGGVVSNATQIAITTSNTLALYGGIFGGGSLTYLGSITNYGVFQGWGTIVGSLNTGSNVFNNALGFTAVSNQVGALVLSNGFTTATNTVLQISLGTNYYPIAVGLGQADPPASALVSNNDLVLNGIINFVNSGGFTDTTYTLFTYPTSLVGVNSNKFICAPVIGTVPNPSLTYAISTSTPGQINLIVGCTNCAPPVTPVPSITSITRVNSGHDILLQWNTNGTTNNHVQVTTGTANGSYSASGFANLANIVVTTATTNYVDVGGATNTPSRYYRISSP
ncbi:MAG: hypothetical protein ABSD58_00615 [Verrucomicrobiia bacterium]